MIPQCFDWPLPPEQRVIAARLAVAERWDNAGLRNPTGVAPHDLMPFLALDARCLWETGRTLGVGFLDGTQWQHDVVRTHAVAWSDYANILQDFDSPTPQIRIRFEPGQGSKSRVGTDALVGDPTATTMNLGWIDRSKPDDELRGVVLHEFGHALGCIHEHQSPDAGIPWNLEAVFAYYSGDPNYWTPEETQFNLIDTYDRSYTKFSAFDARSIMVYPIPVEHTIGGFHVDPTYDLSDGDKAFIGRIYPNNQPVDTLSLDSPVAIERRSAAQEDQFRIQIDVAGRYVIETSGPTNVRLAVFGPDNRGRQVAADSDSARDGYNARVDTILIPGGYWVRVHHEQDVPGEYQLRATRVA